LFKITVTLTAAIILLMATTAPIVVNATLNDTGNTTTSQNFSMAQNAGNRVFNQMMCNKDPSYCAGGMNAPP